MRRTPPASRLSSAGGLLAILLCVLVSLAGATHAQSGDSPTVSIDNPTEGETVNGTVDVSGTASAPNGSVDEVEVRIDGAAWETASGTDTWSYTWDTTSESDGDHKIEARSWSGNNSSAIDVVNVTVDNQAETNEPPTVSIENPTEGETVNGTVDVSGTASDPEGNLSSVEVRIDGGSWQTASGTSSWSYSWNSSDVQDGDHKIEARAHDDNTSSAIDVVNVTVDNEAETNEPPTVTIDTPSEGATVSGTVEVSGTASDPDGSVSTVEVRVDGSSWQTASGTDSWTWSWDTTSESDGGHTLEARASDGSTHSGTASRNVTVDNDQDSGGSTDTNDPPSVTLDRPTDGSTVEGLVQIEGRAWDADGRITTVEVRIDNGAWQTASGTGSWSFPWDSDQVQEGEHSITARAFDDDGARNTAWTTVTVNRTSEDGASDGANESEPNEPPELTVLEPEQNETVSGTVLVSGTANDPDGELDTLELRIDDWGWRTRNASTSWVESWNMSSVPEGEHVLTVRLTDEDGATDIVLRRIVVERTDGEALEPASHVDDTAAGNASSSNDVPPTVELSSTTGDRSVEGELLLEGVATDPDDPSSLVVEYRIDGGEWQAFDVEPGERFERSIPVDDLSSGEHEISVRAHDGLHRSDVDTASFEVAGTGGTPIALAALVFALLAGGGLVAWARHTETSP